MPNITNQLREKTNKDFGIGLYRNFHLLIRIISFILIITFLAQDIAWAYPDKLAPESFFHKPGSRESASGQYVKMLAERTGIPEGKLTPEAIAALDRKRQALETQIILPSLAQVSAITANISQSIVKSEETPIISALTFGDIVSVPLLLISSFIFLKLIRQMQSRADKNKPTGLYNRDYFNRELDKELKIARGGGKRRGYPLALLMIDGDDFSGINRKYGKKAGDEVVKAVSTIIKDNTRKYDTVAIYGGEEIAVLMPEVSMEEAVAAAERIRSVVAGLEVDVKNGFFVRPTVSIGVAAYDPITGETRTDFIKRARSALKISKENGKNRVTPYHSGQDVPFIPRRGFAERYQNYLYGLLATTMLITGLCISKIDNMAFLYLTAHTWLAAILIGVLTIGWGALLIRAIRSLKFRADIDGLTGLYKQDYFDRALEKALARAMRIRSDAKNNKVSVLMVDPYEFKVINDTYGYETGDRILREIADCIKHSGREYDVASRYERLTMALLLPGADEQAAHNVAFRIIEEVRKIKVDEKADAVGVSIGVATYPLHVKSAANPAVTRDGLIYTADNALSTAKQIGKNNITVASEAALSKPRASASGSNARSGRGRRRARQPNEDQLKLGIEKVTEGKPDLTKDIQEAFLEDRKVKAALEYLGLSVEKIGDIYYINHSLLAPHTIEFRAYQATMARLSTEANTLTILPTGLGKTTIALLALCKILSDNLDTKVLIAVPTKALVEQWHKYLSRTLPAQKIGKIRSEDKTLEKRRQIWEESNVIIATSDLVEEDIARGSQVFNLRNTACLIVDEAHHIIERHPSNIVVEEYAKVNPKGLRLGFTASPGKNIGTISKALGASYDHIDIRTYADRDVKPYYFWSEPNIIEVEAERKFSPIIDILEDMLVDELANVFSYISAKTNEREIRQRNLPALRREFKNITPNRKFIKERIPYLLRRDLLADIKRLLDGWRRLFPNDTYLYQAIKARAKVEILSHALNVVRTHGLYELADYMEGQKKSRLVSAQEICRDRRIKQVLDAAKRLMNEGLDHPKMSGLLNLVDTNKGKKLIVFAAYKSSVANIAEKINSRYGEGTAMYVTGIGEKGMTGKERERRLDSFRKGEFNILVATSALEEGIDLPELDVVVMYEPVSDERRMIQRMGRKGRTHPGDAYILVAKETRDEGELRAYRRRLEEMMHWVEQYHRLAEVMTRRSASGTDEGGRVSPDRMAPDMDLFGDILPEDIVSAIEGEEPPAGQEEGDSTPGVDDSAQKYSLGVLPAAGIGALAALAAMPFVGWAVAAVLGGLFFLSRQFYNYQVIFQGLVGKEGGVSWRELLRSGWEVANDKGSKHPVFKYLGPVTKAFVNGHESVSHAGSWYAWGINELRADMAGIRNVLKVHRFRVFAIALAILMPLSMLISSCAPRSQAPVSAPTAKAEPQERKGVPYEIQEFIDKLNKLENLTEHSNVSQEISDFAIDFINFIKNGTYTNEEIADYCGLKGLRREIFLRHGVFVAWECDIDNGIPWNEDFKERFLKYVKETLDSLPPEHVRACKLIISGWDEGQGVHEYDYSIFCFIGDRSGVDGGLATLYHELGHLHFWHSLSLSEQEEFSKLSYKGKEYITSYAATGSTEDYAEMYREYTCDSSSFDRYYQRYRTQNARDKALFVARQFVLQKEDGYYLRVYVKGNPVDLKLRSSQGALSWSEFRQILKRVATSPPSTPGVDEGGAALCPDRSKDDPSSGRAGGSSIVGSAISNLVQVLSMGVWLVISMCLGCAGGGISRSKKKSADPSPAELSATEREMLDKLNSLTGCRLKYGLRPGFIANNLKPFYNTLFVALRENGVDERSAERLAQTITQMNQGSLEIMYITGVITEKEKNIFIDKNSEGLLALDSQTKHQLSHRLKELIDSYTWLTQPQCEYMMKRLIPLTIVAPLAYVNNTSRSQMLLIIKSHPDFPVWLPKAKAKVGEIKDTVYGLRNAWNIVYGQGLDKVDAWLPKAEAKVAEIGSSVGGYANAWAIVIRQGLKKVDSWVTEAKGKVKKIVKRVGGSRNAWLIVAGHRLDKVDAWVSAAELKVKKIAKQVGGERNAWDIVIGQGLDDVDSWLETAEKVVKRIEGRVHGLRNAWHIVIGQGLSNVDSWLETAERTVNVILESEECKSSQAWRRVISQKLEVTLPAVRFKPETPLGAASSLVVEGDGPESATPPRRSASGDVGSRIERGTRDEGRWTRDERRGLRNALAILCAGFGGVASLDSAILLVFGTISLILIAVWIKIKLNQVILTIYTIRALKDTISRDRKYNMFLLAKLRRQLEPVPFFGGYVRGLCLGILNNNHEPQPIRAEAARVLGVNGDGKAFEPLKAIIAEYGDHPFYTDLAGACISALGEIATPESMKYLLGLLPKEPQDIEQGNRSLQLVVLKALATSVRVAYKRGKRPVYFIELLEVANAYLYSTLEKTGRHNEACYLLTTMEEGLAKMRPVETAAGLIDLLRSGEDRLSPLVKVAITSVLCDIWKRWHTDRKVSVLFDDGIWNEFTDILIGLLPADPTVNGKIREALGKLTLIRPESRASVRDKLIAIIDPRPRDDIGEEDLIILLNRQESAIWALAEVHYGSKKAYRALFDLISFYDEYRREGFQSDTVMLVKQVSNIAETVLNNIKVMRFREESGIRPPQSPLRFPEPPAGGTRASASGGDDRSQGNAAMEESVRTARMARVKRTAEIYSAFKESWRVGLLIWLSWAAFLRPLRRFLAKDIGDGMRGKTALSIGVGIASVEERLVTDYGLKVVGVDIVPEFLEEARKKGVVTHLVEDGQELPFIKDNSVDIVLLLESIGHMDHKKVLLEAWRVLRSGGKIYITTYKPSSLQRWIFDYRERKIFDLVGAMYDSGFIRIEDRTHHLPMWLYVLSSVPGYRYITAEKSKIDGRISREAPVARRSGSGAGETSEDASRTAFPAQTEIIPGGNISTIPFKLSSMYWDFAGFSFPEGTQFGVQTSWTNHNHGKPSPFLHYGVDFAFYRARVASLQTDIPMPSRAKICAVKRGVVVAVERDNIKGITVAIRHKGGLISIYEHLSAEGLAVQKGSRVREMDVIGKLATAEEKNNSSPAHLHFELAMVRDGKVYMLNPLRHLVFPPSLKVNMGFDLENTPDYLIAEPFYRDRILSLIGEDNVLVSQGDTPETDARQSASGTPQDAERVREFRKKRWDEVRSLAAAYQESQDPAVLERILAHPTVMLLTRRLAVTFGDGTKEGREMLAAGLRAALEEYLKRPGLGLGENFSQGLIIYLAGTAGNPFAAPVEAENGVGKTLNNSTAALHRLLLHGMRLAARSPDFHRARDGRKVNKALRDIQGITKRARARFRDISAVIRALSIIFELSDIAEDEINSAKEDLAKFCRYLEENEEKLDRLCCASEAKSFRETALKEFPGILPPMAVQAKEPRKHRPYVSRRVFPENIEGCLGRITQSHHELNLPYTRERIGKILEALLEMGNEHAAESAVKVLEKSTAEWRYESARDLFFALVNPYILDTTIEKLQSFIDKHPPLKVDDILRKLTALESTMDTNGFLEHIRGAAYEVEVLTELEERGYEVLAAPFSDTGLFLQGDLEFDGIVRKDGRNYILEATVAPGAVVETILWKVARRLKLLRKDMPVGGARIDGVVFACTKYAKRYLDVKKMGLERMLSGLGTGFPFKVELVDLPTPYHYDAEMADLGSNREGVFRAGEFYRFLDAVDGAENGRPRASASGDNGLESGGGSLESTAQSPEPMTLYSQLPTPNSELQMRRSASGSISPELQAPSSQLQAPSSKLEIRQSASGDTATSSEGSITYSIHNTVGSYIATNPIPEGTKILLSENLFNPDDIAALKCVLNKAHIEVLDAETIRAKATNNGKGRMVCAVTREEFGRLWKDSHRNNNKVHIVVLDDTLKDSNYLYLEGLIAFLMAIVNDHPDRIRMFASLIFEGTIPDDAIEALKKDNPIEFTKLILKFKPITVIETKQLEDEKKNMEKFLVAA